MGVSVDCPIQRAPSTRNASPDATRIEIERRTSSASSTSRFRLRPRKLGAHSESHVNNKISLSGQQDWSSIRRFSIRRKKQQPPKQTRSMPVATVTTPLKKEQNLSSSMPGNYSTSSSPSSRKRTRRRRISLNFLRRDSSKSSFISMHRDKSRSKDSKSSSRGSVTDDSDFDERFRGNHSPSLMERTQIVAKVIESPSSNSQGSFERKTSLDIVEEQERSYVCATAILGHTYLERICGGVKGHPSFDDIHSKAPEISEDPTVQESIECIFASQLENGLALWEDEEEREELDVPENKDPALMVSPTLLQQSRQNRSDRVATSLSQSKKRYEQASLVYVGTFDPTILDTEKIVEGQEGAMSCHCAKSDLPALSPSEWPQAPLLLRPTPGRGTRIKGVRMGSSKDYFWEPASHLSWSECLAKKWGIPCKSAPRVGCCERCATLPINNGNEPDGEGMIIDFESELFEGSLLLRLRHTNGTTKEPYDDNKGYFKGMNRRYQAVVRGRFKRSIPWTELRTGFQFERPCGKLPAKWILRGAIKVLSFFAPQLDAKMEGDKPHSLTPLGSTPQSITADSGEEPRSIEAQHEEPTEGHRTLLGQASELPSSLQRARARKKAFDKLFVQNSKTPRTDPSKIYTFEFLQHLFNFQDFSVELGSMLGSVQLKDLLDGQPLQIMGSHGQESLWSFDVWHECLWDSAKQHEARRRQR